MKRGQLRSAAGPVSMRDKDLIIDYFTPKLASALVAVDTGG